MITSDNDQQLCYSFAYFQKKLPWRNVTDNGDGDGMKDGDTIAHQVINVVLDEANACRATADTG